MAPFSLMAGLLLSVGSQASDVADSSALQGFLSNYVPVGTQRAPTSLNGYVPQGLSEAEYKAAINADKSKANKNKQRFPTGSDRTLNVAKYLKDLEAKQQFKNGKVVGSGHTFAKAKFKDQAEFDKAAGRNPIFGGRFGKFILPAVSNVKHGNGPDALSHHNNLAEHGLAVDDIKEKKAVQDLLAYDSIKPNTLSAIGIGLLSLATLLGVRMWRGMQQITVVTSGGVDMPNNTAPMQEEGAAVFAVDPKHPYYEWQAKTEAGCNGKAPAAYYKEKSQYELGWFGKYDDSKTEAERSEKFLARHDGVGGESSQERTKERVYAEIAALKEERAARARRARGSSAPAVFAVAPMQEEDKVDAICALATDSIKELSSRNSHHLGELLGKTPFASVLLTSSARPAIFALTPNKGTPGVYAAALELANKLKSQQQPAPPKQLPTDLHCPSNWPTFLAALTRQAGAVTLGAGLMASTAFPSYAADTLLLADKQPGQIQYQQLEDCAKSAKFQKRRTKSTGAIEARMAKYEPGSPPYLALEQTLNQTNARFQRYADSNVLCGKDGLPHLIVDGDPEYFAQFVFPGLGFLYTAGYIGTAGRKYLKTVSKTKNPAEKEIIIEVPLALSIMLSNYLWPVDAWKEFIAGDLVANKEEITVSPR